MTRCEDIADFSLRMRIPATFLLPAEVLVTDSESHTLHFLFILNSDCGSTWLSFRDVSMRQTGDRRTTQLLKVSHLFRQAGHVIVNEGMNNARAEFVGRDRSASALLVRGNGRTTLNEL